MPCYEKINFKIAKSFRFVFFTWENRIMNNKILIQFDSAPCMPKKTAKKITVVFLCVQNRNKVTSVSRLERSGINYLIYSWVLSSS